MADVLGVATSVITIAQVVTGLVKHLKTFYRAQEEFDALQAIVRRLRMNEAHILQEQLENFTALVNEIESQNATFSSLVIAACLSQAKSTIEQLHEIIQVKVLQNVNGKSRARRRAWTRNKSKIYRIRDALKVYRENLLIAISSISLLSVRRSEAALTVLSHEVMRKESVLSPDRRLSKIHQPILETQDTASWFQSEVSRPTLQSNLSHSLQLQQTGEKLSLPWNPSRSFYNPSVHPFSSQSHHYAESFPNLPILMAEDNQAKMTEQENEGDIFLQHYKSSAACGPASSFETSPSFSPEIYTTDQQVPTSSLIVASFNEINSSMHSRTNYYRAIYLRSPRQWSGLDISIEINSSSRYWTATKLSQYESNPLGWTPIKFACSLPQSLLKQIQTYLSTVDDHGENINIRLCLSTEDIIQRQQHRSVVRSLSATESPSTIQSILTFLDDLGCQRYFESQVIQVEMIEPPTHFASLVNGILVSEIKFARNCPSHKDFYNIQVLRAMDGIPGFARLVGIVVDWSGKYLKGYLVELPQGKWNRLRDLMALTSVISWERREKWARQIVEGVRQLHRQNFVMGTLWRVRPTILIDSCDRVMFWNFKEHFVLGTCRSCCYLPEYTNSGKLSPFTSGTECPNMTAKSDIFLLGMALWYLAIGYPVHHLSGEQTEETQPLAIPFELQGLDGPISLPQLSDSIPKYYRDIVDQCMLVDPNDRPAAWRLLERFPPDSESMYSENKDLEPGSVDLNSFRKAFKNWIWCHYCQVTSRESYFHCNVCEEGFLNICLKCYNQGLHCFQRDHLLIEMEPTENQSWKISKRYHSIVRMLGKRDIVEI